jgi:hypothetical protein
MEAAKEKWSVEIQAGKTELAVVVALGDFGVVNLVQLCDELDKRRPSYVARDKLETLLLRDLKIRFVLNEESVCSEIPKCSSSYLVTVNERRRLRVQETLPKFIGEQILRQRLDKYPIMELD